MMSHGSGGFGKAVCTSTMKRPTDEVCEILGDDCRSPKKEDFCAAHLASLCDGAIAAARADGGRCGRVLEYGPDIADVFVEDVLPNLFGVDERGDEATAAMRATATQYSKAAEGKHRGGTFASDSERKERSATKEAKEAVEFFLLPRYRELVELTSADQSTCPGRAGNS